MPKTTKEIKNTIDGVDILWFSQEEVDKIKAQIS